MFRQLLEYTASNSKVYHIRGTATADFDFTLKYIDDKTNAVTTVTEHAVIDGNGKWDVSYSGKKIYGMARTFYQNNKLITIEFTEKLEQLIELNYNSGDYQNFGTFHQANNLTTYYLTSVKFADGTKFDKINRMSNTFRRCKSLKALDLKDATFEKVDFNSSYDTFDDCTSLEVLNLSKIQKFKNGILDNCTALTTIYLPQNQSWQTSISFKDNPLSYDSMLQVAGWLKDLSGGTAQTVTFKADTYNALTAEQKDTLQGIIVTQKNWILATA